MIKGGFQGLDISGVDLTAQSPTLSGGYAACQAADGKTVLVLTAAGAVQCSVKKVSTNYVLAGITGDGKILSITIGSTDVISVSETIPASAEEPDYRLGTSVDITGYTSNEPYTAPSDGFVRLKNNSVAETARTVNTYRVIFKQGNTDTDLIFMPASSAARYCTTIFVKKGIKVFTEKIGSAEETASVRTYFYPLAAV